MPVHHELPMHWAKYIQACRDLLGLGTDWHIFVKLVDNAGGQKDKPGDGWTLVNVRYLRAEIEIKRDLDDDRAYEVILHELWHVALGWLVEVSDKAIAQIPDELHKGFREELRDDVLEQTIERLCRSIMRSIKPESLIEKVGDDLHIEVEEGGE
jgi:hypothetical protein